MSVSEILEIPKFYYFDSGNDYSGSKGDFAYKIITAEKLTAKTWHGRFFGCLFCYLGGNSPECRKSDSSEATMLMLMNSRTTETDDKKTLCRQPAL